MPYTLVCPRCNYQSSIDGPIRFCPECGSLLKQAYVELGEPTEYPLNEERFEIAKYVYQEYESLRESYGDLELDMLEKIKTTSANDRFDMVFLATLFSGWAMKEERAYSIWEDLTEDFQQRSISLYEHLVSSHSPPVEALASSYGVPPKISLNIWSTARNLKHCNGDIEGLKVEGNWYRTLENIRNTCKGVNQKAFWIARVMRQKKTWDVAGRYCCVSDSHNKSFLRKTGFIKNDEDLYNNSLVMWRYFNEPFANHYYDLPVFRFARSHKCKKCNRNICNLEILSNC